MHEHYRDFGLINMNGRLYDPLVGRMLSPDIVIQDPEYSQSYNRYSYCFNNPLRFTDPSGYVVRGRYDGFNPQYFVRFNPFNSSAGNAFNTDIVEGQPMILEDRPSIDVTDNGDNTYTIVGGNIDNNRNVYVVDEYGNRTGEIIGTTLTDYSFFNDDKVVVENAIINLNDNSGQDFFDHEIRYDDPNIVHYMLNGYGGQKYDFKHRGHTESMDKEIYYHRGMMFNGFIASGRDIGNVAAGFIAAKNSISWQNTRLTFDLLETIQHINNNGKLKFMTEGPASQSAQLIGFGYGLFINRN